MYSYNKYTKRVFECQVEDESVLAGVSRRKANQHWKQDHFGIRGGLQYWLI
jgi:hypothetical protein